MKFTGAQENTFRLRLAVASLAAMAALRSRTQRRDQEVGPSGEETKFQTG